MSDNNPLDVLGRERAARLRDDPVMFVRAFDREPWPFQADILRQALARDDGGKFSHRISVISMPRQNSKSTISAWAALWRFYCEPEQTIISVANDAEQAALILHDARRIIRNSAILFDAIDDYGLNRYELRLKNGNRWIVKSADSVASRGLRPSLICYDELGWAVDRDLFDTLSAGQAAQPNPLIIVTSTVGPVQAGILWELFELARAGDKSVSLFYSQENLSPLISEEYLERERAILPPSVFAREHLNTWGAGSDAFCSLKDWERAIAYGSPLKEWDAGPSVAFLDLGWTHDETALVVGKRDEDGRVAILALETWQGSQAAPVSFAAIERRLLELAKQLHIRRLVIESPQGVGMAQRLNLAGVVTETLHPTATSNRENWGALYTALRDGDIALPDDARLRRQLLTLTIESKATGWRVVDAGPAIHNDRAVAVAGVVRLLAKRIDHGLPPIKGLEERSRWRINDGYRREPEPWGNGGRSSSRWNF